MKIYQSPCPPVPLSSCSIYTHILPTPDPFNEDTVAYIDAQSGKSLTRRHVRHFTLSLGWALRNYMGRAGAVELQKGDTVMMFSPNSLSWPIAVLGAVAAGLRVTLANSAYTPRELAHQLSDSGASLIFVHPLLLPTAIDTYELLKVPRAEIKKRIIVAAWGENHSITGYISLDELLDKGKLEHEEKFDGDQVNETVYIGYSSGTTGKPKGVEITHRNITSMLQIFRPLIPDLQHGKDVMLGVLPFYHAYGAARLLQYPLIVGVPVVIMKSFDPIAFFANIEKYKVTMAPVVPPILVVLAMHPAVDSYDFRSLEILLSGAAPLGAPLVHAVRQRLAKKGANVTIAQGYGLTEISLGAIILHTDYALEKIGSCGVLLPNMEARLVVDDKKDAAEGEPGELWVRGPNIMKGYLNNPTATANSITKDGWFKTGDIAVRDKDGFYTIIDRQKELIKYKGFQVPPADLESVLLTHPDIADAGVIGVHSAEQATELPRAYVVPKGGEAIFKTREARVAFEKGVQKWIEGEVARHKYLRGGVVVIAAIPKSASGKILRRELRERAKKEIGSGDPQAKL